MEHSTMTTNSGSPLSRPLWIPTGTNLAVSPPQWGISTMALARSMNTTNTVDLLRRNDLERAMPEKC